MASSTLTVKQTISTNINGKHKFIDEFMFHFEFSLSSYQENELTKIPVSVTKLNLID